jgi:hypothetical protein
VIYQMIDKHGQTHVGYFVVGADRKLRIIKREQYRGRVVAEGRFNKRCQRTANVSQGYIVRFVVSADAGQVERYDTEQSARDAMAASMKPGPEGVVRAIEVHLFHPTPGQAVALPLPTVDVQAASAASWEPQS